jgi:hypothetical protein
VSCRGTCAYCGLTERSGPPAAGPATDVPPGALTSVADMLYQYCPSADAWPMAIMYTHPV